MVIQGRYLRWRRLDSDALLVFENLDNRLKLSAATYDRLSTMQATTQYNLSTIFEAKTDSYAKSQGEFVLGETVRVGLSHGETFDFLTQLGGKLFRVIYECLDGKRLDIIGRQGVYNSAQDGRVANAGHSMRSEKNLTISFHTSVHGGRKVNTGKGKGYRTLRCAGILAIRVDGIDILTNQGQCELLDYLAN